MIACEFRRFDPLTEQPSCLFAAQFLGGRTDLTLVSDSTCRTCQDFYKPTLSDPNPVVASIIFQVAEQQLGPDAKLTQWATPHLRCGNPNDPVKEEGLDRDAFDFGSCGKHADPPTEPVSESPCLCLVRSREDVVGNGEHRSGWPFAFESLQPLACTAGILFDDFVEHRFCYHVGAPGYQEPWIGIFHHPPEDFELAGRRNSLECMFQTRFWRDSEPHLIGGITLSEYLAEFLRARLGRQFVSVLHPVAAAPRHWSPTAFQANRDKRLVQIGWYLRNTHAIHQVGRITGFSKWRIFHRVEQMERYNQRVEEFLAQRGRPVTRCPQVVERGYISNEEYDRLLTSNVIFCELIAASANNVVVDCIAAHTPLVVNRHPAVVEYLGPDYPLFYDELSQVRSMLTEDRVFAAHEYLRNIVSARFRGGTFRQAVGNAVRRLTADS